MDGQTLITNPYRPGAGHTPPVLAGRTAEQQFFRRLLRQGFATSNILITGLRGFGKTVLLEDLRKMAETEGWLWVGNDLSESSSLSEDRLALRILTDLSHSLSRIVADDPQKSGSMNGSDPSSGHNGSDLDEADMYTFDALKAMYERTPGLPSDKLKAVLMRLSSVLVRARARGIVFAYDEAQCLSDHAGRDQYPMSLLVETIATLQKREGVAPCLLIFSGLPQVFEALTQTRTYTERMFHVMTLDRLNRDETMRAIAGPLGTLTPLDASDELLNKAVNLSGGYPYLIQFFGKELVEQLIQNGGVLRAEHFPSVEALERLDAGLFAARWNKTTDKQREFLRIIAERDKNGSSDFSAREIAALSQGTVTNQQASQMLAALCDRGLVYRSRHGRYAFTVPMSEVMIKRRLQSEDEVINSWMNGTPPQNHCESNGHGPVVGNGANGHASKSWKWGWFR